MRKLTRIGFRVLCLFTLFAVSFTSQAQDSLVLDTNPPVILSAVAGGDGQTIIVTYSEPVEPNSAADNFNYEVQDGQSNRLIIIFAFMADPQTLFLQVTPPLSPQSSNTLHVVFGIPDLAGNELQPGVAVPIKFDITPPIVTCSVVLSMLFPPNKALVNVGLTAATDSSGSPVQVQVYSDEPAPPSVADATYQNGVLELSARRDPGADGRVYLIVVTSTDEFGNVGGCCTTVIVPRNGSAAALSSVQTQAAAAQSQCSPSGSPSTPHLILP